MGTYRLAFISSFALAAAGTGCRQRADRPGEDAGSQASGDTVAGAASCAALDTHEPNAPDQRPAFPGQRRACAIVSAVAFDVVVLAKGLEHPWAVEPLPGGDLLVTERPGRLRIVSASGRVGPPVANLPQVDARGQGGLLDVALSPAFDSDRTIFWAYSEPRTGGN